MVSLRGLTLTAARPRIIVPLFARDPAALCPLAKAAGADPAAELVELLFIYFSFIFLLLWLSEGRKARSYGLFPG